MRSDQPQVIRSSGHHVISACMGAGNILLTWFCFSCVCTTKQTDTHLLSDLIFKPATLNKNEPNIFG